MRTLNIFLLLLIASLALFGCGSAQAPAKSDETPAESEAPASDRGTAQHEIGGATISIDYGRPSLGGRDMLSQLPDGQIWRLGMNEATEMDTSANLAFGDTTIEAGQYSLWALKVNADEWHLVVNSQTGIWGTAHNASTDIAHIPLEKSELPESVEQFTIEVNPSGDNSGELVFEWSTLQLKAGFQVQ